MTYRDPLLQPYMERNLLNTPIGEGFEYQPATLPEWDGSFKVWHELTGWRWLVARVRGRDTFVWVERVPGPELEK